MGRINVSDSMELADKWGKLGSLRIKRVLLSPAAWKVPVSYTHLRAHET